MKINRNNARHYKWKDVCDGWHFVESNDLSIIVEKMPPGTKEDKHYHNISKQFFYVLSGQLTITIDDKKIMLDQGDGVEIQSKIVHQVINNSKDEVEFIVKSLPKSHGDKVICS